MKLRYVYILICIVLLLSGCTKKADDNNIQNNDGKSEKLIGGLSFIDRNGYLNDVSFGVYQNADELIKESSLIISGKIIEKKEKTEEGSFPSYWDIYSVEITKVFKGTYDDKILELELNGTNIGFLESEFSDEINLEEGGEYLLLLNYESENNAYILSSVAQSIYNINNDYASKVSGISITKNELLDALEFKDE